MSDSNHFELACLLVSMLGAALLPFEVSSFTLSPDGGGGRFGEPEGEALVFAAVGLGGDLGVAC